MEKLPYDFDLHFDIKTEAELFALYTKLKSDITFIEELMKIHGYTYKEIYIKDQKGV